MRIGWTLMAAPAAIAAPATAGRSAHRQVSAPARKSSGPTWPSFRAYRKGHESPASNRTAQRTDVRTGSTVTPKQKAATSIPTQASVAV